MLVKLRVLSRIAVGVISLLLLMELLGPPAAIRADTSQLRKAPTRATSVVPPPVIDGHGTGFVPPKMILSHLTGQTLPGMLQGANFSQPASLDWRTQGKVTPVKDQEGCGSCYAFAALANIESKLLIDDTGCPYDFSENNAKECNWYETDGSGASCIGGTYDMMANWFSKEGTVLESCDPYVAGDVDCTGTCTYQKTLLDWRIICDASIPDTDVLKSYIQTDGPVFTSMRPASIPDSGFYGYDGSYNIPYYSTGVLPNTHAVVIVGWDDSLTYSGPSGDGSGCWIVKNSWGTDWGGTCGYGSERGYFTIAYESAGIGKYSSFMYDWQDYDDSGELWYYDEAGWTNALSGGTDTLWGLCQFTPSSDIYITRVEFWTTDVTTDIDVYIWGSFDGTSLSDLRAQKPDSSFTEAGYHSVALDLPLAVTSGDDIFAVVKFTNESDTTFPLPVDDYGPLETGRTYASTTGNNGDWIALGAGQTDPLDCDAAIRVRTSSFSNSISAFSDSSHCTHCNNFSDYDTEHMLYIYGTGYTVDHAYKVVYYDGAEPAGLKVWTDTLQADGSGGLSSHREFSPATDTGGTWHVIVCDSAYNPPSTYDSNWANTLACDSFSVQESVIPEFPVILAAAVSLSLCVGIYFLMRRKAAKGRA